MKLGSVVLVVELFALSTLAQYTERDGQDQVSRREADFTYLPACATECLLQTTDILSCESDLSCVCVNNTLLAQTSSCVLANCTVREALRAKEWTVEVCDSPARSQRAGVLSLTWVMYGAALIAILMRLLARLSGTGLSWDDGLAAGCMLLLTVLAVLVTLMVVYGLGHDIWTVKYDEVYNFFEFFYVNEIIYVALNGCIKISILLLYLRIFPKTVSHDFRYLCWFMISICTAYLLSNSLVFIFQCHPVAYAWTSWDGQHTGHCIDIQAFNYASIATNIALEVVVFILPIPRLLRIDMCLRKKIVACLTFTVGFTVTGCSIARAVTLPSRSSTNPTWDFVRLAELSMAESSLGIMCACLPPGAQLLRKLVHSKRSDYAEGGSPFSSKRNSRMITPLDVLATRNVEEMSPVRTETTVEGSWEQTTTEQEKRRWGKKARDGSDGSEGSEKDEDGLGLEAWPSEDTLEGSGSGEGEEDGEDDHEKVHEAAHRAHVRFGGVVQ
ncbi:cfem domain-containing protein [Teratosphaeria destructans]|uniref:Cfem domain-containing protein n=1 Tax=Teratosphaeria destructans TaxID=418781 RepID=A0A9W7ST60_9PEZI|nr:cfem domain-containing protein [Teratosphaeria destructans]